MVTFNLKLPYLKHDSERAISHYSISIISERSLKYEIMITDGIMLQVFALSFSLLLSIKNIVIEIVVTLVAADALLLRSIYE